MQWLSQNELQTSIRPSAIEFPGRPALNLIFSMRFNLRLDWQQTLTGIDWTELSALYRAAPLGEKGPSDLERAFTNSMFKLIALSAGHRKIILYSVPGKEPFYRGLGFKRMSTAMAIFEDQTRAREGGLVNDT